MKINIDRVICNTFLFSIIGYYAQGVLYSSESLISKIFLLLIIVISTFHFFYLTLFSITRLSLFVKIWTVLLIINFIGFIFYGYFDDFVLFRAIILNMLPFYSFYFFSKKNILLQSQLQIFFYCLLPIVIVRFLNSESNLLENFNDRNGEVINNSVYMIIGLLPFIFILRNRILSILMLSLSLFFIIRSSKRAAIICGSISLILYLIMLYREQKQKSRLFKFIFIVPLISFLVFTFYRYIFLNEYLVTRLTKMVEGDSSGRDVLIQRLTDKWLNADSFINLIFGFGFNSSRQITGAASHNDWIELIVSFGLVGFLTYLLLFIYGIKEQFKGNWDYRVKLMYICIFSIAIIVSLSSRWYASNFPYMHGILLPYLLNNKYKVV